MLRFNPDVRIQPRLAALCAVAALLTLAGPVQAQERSSGADLDAIFADQPCQVTKALAQLDAPIAHVSKRLEAHEPVIIVALGSSSTAGARASSPAFTYPARLERELHRAFPRDDISVVNRGVNGEEAADMMVRLDDVLKTKPDLVIWQVGTNAVLRNHDVTSVGDLLQTGIAKIKDSGADVLLIDPQFAPEVNNKPKLLDMIGLIGGIAKRMHVALFRRYHAMRHWNEDQAIGFDRFISADGVHMNDWGYSCLARLLAENITNAVTRSRALADVKPAQ